VELSVKKFNPKKCRFEGEFLMPELKSTDPECAESKTMYLQDWDLNPHAVLLHNKNIQTCLQLYSDNWRCLLYGTLFCVCMEMHTVE